MTLETCANCGQPIGALETACVWKDRTVCAACHARLNADALPPPPIHTSPTPSSPPPEIVVSGKADGPTFICPNAQCGYQGPSIRKAKGSAIVGVILLFLMVLPGLLYLIFMSGYTYCCPRCGVAVKL